MNTTSAAKHGCHSYGNLTICYGPKRQRVIDEPDGDARWCFRCRATRAFRYTFDRPIFDEQDPYASIYVVHAIRCAECGQADSDLFPGRERMWDE